MDFFYRHKPWYAGQFIRKIIPKIELDDDSIIFFTNSLSSFNSNNLNKLDICLSSILNLSCVDKVVLGIDSNAQLLDLVNYNHIFNYPAMNIKNISENLTNPTKWSI